MGYLRAATYQSRNGPASSPPPVPACCRRRKGLDGFRRFRVTKDAPGEATAGIPSVRNGALRLWKLMTTSFDVLVVGGGPAGIAAAAAAGRLGMRTALVEAGRALGGLSTLGLCMTAYHDGNGDPVAGGLAEEIAERLARGGGPRHVRWPGGPLGSVTPVDPAGLQAVLGDLVREAGVHVLLEHTGTDVVWERGSVAGAVVQGAEGRFEVQSRAVVDATAN